MVVSSVEKSSSMQLPSFLDQWIDVAKRTDYISHAIWPTLRHAALAQGVLYPAEQKFRERKRVEHEAGMYGYRKVSEMLSLSEERQEELKAQALPFAFEDEYTPRMKAEVERLGTKAHPRDLLYLRHHSQKPVYPSFYERSQLARQWGLHSCYDINLLQDTLLPEEQRADTRLCAYYQSQFGIAKEMFEDDIRARQTAWERTMEIRNYALGRTALNCDIRTAYNCIAWRYGSVVVLRHTPHSAIGYRYSASEAGLLAPFQNGGRFFSWPLNDPDTIVLAPKRVEKTYRNKYSIFALKDLTEEQAEFFKVPDKLRPQPRLVSQGTSRGATLLDAAV